MKNEWYVECVNPHDQLLVEFAQKKLLSYLIELGGEEAVTCWQMKQMYMELKNENG